MTGFGWKRLVGLFAGVFASVSLAIAAEPNRSLSLRSIDGMATIFVSCGKGGTADVAVVGRYHPPAFRPPRDAQPTLTGVSVVYSVSGRGPFIEEWQRRDDFAVVTGESDQAKRFLLRLLGRELLFFSVQGRPSFEFNVEGLSPRLSDLVAGCK
jgi:hypothetical protein